MRYANLSLSAQTAYAHAGKNLSLALPTNVRMDTREALAPLKFMEFSLENPLQACVFSKDGACMINVPAPERYAVHKLIVYGERPVNERTKARKDLHQAAALIQYLLEQGDEERLRAAREDAVVRGRGWQKRLEQGWSALQQLAPLEFHGRIKWLLERG